MQGKLRQSTKILVVRGFNSCIRAYLANVTCWSIASKMDVNSRVVAFWSFFGCLCLVNTDVVTL